MMASRLFLRGAVLQLRRSLNGGGRLPLSEGSGFSRPLVGFSQVGSWAGRPLTGRLDFPGACCFFSGSGSGSGSGGGSSAWLGLEYGDVVAILLPVFMIDRYQKYKLDKELQKKESARENLVKSSLKKKRKRMNFH